MQMKTLRFSFSRLSAFVLLGAMALFNATAQGATAHELENKADLDSDHDGMSDALEQALLVQFAPRFMVSRHDCAGLPARFTPNVENPTMKAEDGTIYGQVSPAKSSGSDLSTAEIHYYHLWASDCGPHGHPLDAEYVAVLVSATDHNLDAAQWKAVYWYAAAHENTVCDVSQITRASTLGAEKSGARVWISPGKHASYLNQKLCHTGCGADRCEDEVALRPGKIVNLGEARYPMNGSVFIASSEWPLKDKMNEMNFQAEPIARLNLMPDTDIAWFSAGRHPAQGIIADSSATEQAIADSASLTTSSLSKAGSATGLAISVTRDDTGNALQKSYGHTIHALGTSARRVGGALHPHQESGKSQ